MNIKNIITITLFFSFLFVFGCNDNKSYFDKAVSCQNDADYTKAIEFYNLAIGKGEKIAESEKNLGDIFLSDKKFDEAIEHYKKSIESDPNVALERVIKFISYNDEHVRELFGDMFSKINNEQAIEKINEYISKILNSGDQYKILDALSVVSKMKGKCTPIFDDIIKLLDSNNIIKQKVLEILPNFSNIISEEVFNKLLNFLSGNDEIIKLATIDCLGDMKEYAVGALPNLINIASSDEKYKGKILSAIEKIGMPTKEQMKDIYPFLQDKSKDIKIHILNIFEKTGEKARDSVPYIIRFLNDKDEDVKMAARNALTKIGKASSETVPELIKLLKENNDEIVSRAIYELGDLGKEASDAIEPLKKIAETTESKDIKKLAKNTLQKIQQ